MEAVICDHFGESRVEDVPKPDISVNEVLVKVERVQLSVTECLLYQNELQSYHPTARDRILEGDGRMFGHEFCGVITETGENVTEFDVGDRISSPGKITCGECAYCEAGAPTHCQNPETPGFERPGALAEFVRLPTEPLVKLPDSVSDAEGAALQPFVSSLNCVYDAGISVGDTVAVLGAGAMGYSCGQLAALQGADQVLAIDIDTTKTRLAEEQGLIGIDAGQTDVVDTVVQDFTGDLGADVTFECVGGAQEHGTQGDDPLAQAFKMTRRGGNIVQVGIMTEDVAFDVGDMRHKFVSWVHPNDQVGKVPLGPNNDTGKRAIQLLNDDRIDIESFVTHELAGLDSFEEAVDITLNKESSGALGPAQIEVP